MSINLVGTDWDIINTDLNTSYTEVTYARPVKDFWFKTRNLTTVFHKRRSADTKYIKIEGGVMPDKKVLLSDSNAAGCSLGFFALESGTDTLEVYVTF